MKNVLNMLTGKYDKRADSTGDLTDFAAHDHSGGDGAPVPESGLVLADNTTGNVSTSKHGFVPKAPSDITKFLDGTGAWSVPAAIYGELYVNEGAVKTADSVTVTDGTVSSGAVADTRTINQTYLVVNESGQFKVDIDFSGLTADPGRFKFIGRYQGNAAHNVKVKAYNYVGAVWDDLTASSTDLASSTTDYEVHILYPADSSMYRSAGASRIRIEHTSASVGTHNLYVDYVKVEQKTYVVTSAGTFYDMSGLTAGESNGITLSAANGSMTVSRAGKYRASAQVSFGGKGATYHSHMFNNGSEINETGFKRTIDSTGSIGSASMTAIITLAANDVVTMKITADTSDVFMVVEYLNFNMHWIGP